FGRRARQLYAFFVRSWQLESGSSPIATSASDFESGMVVDLGIPGSKGFCLRRWLCHPAGRQAKFSRRDHEWSGAALLRQSRLGVLTVFLEESSLRRKKPPTVSRGRRRSCLVTWR